MIKNLLLIIQQAGFILKRMFLDCETPCTTCTAGGGGGGGGGEGGNPNGFMPDGKK